MCTAKLLLAFHYAVELNKHAIRTDLQHSIILLVVSFLYKKQPMRDKMPLTNVLCEFKCDNKKNSGNVLTYLESHVGAKA